MLKIFYSFVSGIMRNLITYYSFSKTISIFWLKKRRILIWIHVLEAK